MAHLEQPKKSIAVSLDEILMQADPTDSDTPAPETTIEIEDVLGEGFTAQIIHRDTNNNTDQNNNNNNNNSENQAQEQQVSAENSSPSVSQENSFQSALNLKPSTLTRDRQGSMLLLHKFEFESDSEDSDSVEELLPRRDVTDMSASNSHGVKTVVRPVKAQKPTAKDYWALALKKAPAAPPKPQPLRAPTQQQYKQYMRERYEYEQWENNVLLLSRRLELKDRHRVTKEELNPSFENKESLSIATMRGANLFKDDEKTQVNPLLGVESQATSNNNSLLNIPTTSSTAPHSSTSNPRFSVSSSSILNDSDEKYVRQVIDELERNYEKAATVIKKSSSEFLKDRSLNEKALSTKQQASIKKVVRGQHRLCKEHSRLIDEQQKKHDPQHKAHLRYDENEPPLVKKFRQASELRMNHDIFSRSQTRIKLFELQELKMHHKKELAKLKRDHNEKHVHLWLEKTLEFYKTAQELIFKSINHFSFSRHKQEQDSLSTLQTSQKKKVGQQVDSLWNPKAQEKKIKKDLKEKEKELEKLGKTKKEIQQITQHESMNRELDWKKKRQEYEDTLIKASEELVLRIRKRFDKADEMETTLLEKKNGIQAEQNYKEVSEYLQESSLEMIKVLNNAYTEMLTLAGDQYNVMLQAIEEDFQIDLKAINNHFDITLQQFETESSKEIQTLSSNPKPKSLFSFEKDKNNQKNAKGKTLQLHSLYKAWVETHKLYQTQAVHSLKLKMLQEKKNMLNNYCEQREMLETERFGRIREMLETYLNFHQNHAFPIWRKAFSYTVGSEELFLNRHENQIIELTKEMITRTDQLKLTCQRDCINLDKAYTTAFEEATSIPSNEEQEEESDEIEYTMDNSRDFSTLRQDKFLIPERDSTIGSMQWSYKWEFDYTYLNMGGRHGANGLNVGIAPTNPTRGQDGSDAPSEETLYLKMANPTTLVVLNSQKQTLIEFPVLLSPPSAGLNPRVLKLNFNGGDGGNGGSALQGPDVELPPELCNGADGGNGGNGSKLTIISEAIELFQLIEVNVHGGKAGRGGLGNEMGEKGMNGQPGADGSVQYIYRPQKGQEIVSATPCHGSILGFSIEEDINSLDMVIEPGEHITISNIRIGNTGGLPLPEGCVLYFRSTQLVLMEPAAVVLPEIPPNHEVTIKTHFMGTITESPEPSFSGPFIRTASVVGVMALANVPFENGCLVKALQIRYPLCFDQISFPSQLASRENAAIDLSLKNISTRPYAKPDEKFTRAALWIHFPKGLTPLTAQPLSETSAGKVLKFPLQTLNPDSSHSYSVSVVCEKNVQIFERLVCRAEIYLRGKVIEYRELPIRVSTPYFMSYNIPGDVLLVTPPEFTRGDYNAWKGLTESLGLRMDIWDLEHQRGLSHIRHNKSWVGQYHGKVVVLPTLVQGCERDLVEHLLGNDHEQALTEMQLKDRDEDEKNKQTHDAPVASQPVVVPEPQDVHNLISFSPSGADPRNLQSLPSSFNLPNRKGPSSGLLLLSTIPSHEIIERLLGATSGKSEKLTEVLTQAPSEEDIRIKAKQLTEEYRRLDPLHLYGEGRITQENNRLITRTGQEAWSYGTFAIPFLPVRKSAHIIQVQHNTPLLDTEEARFSEPEDAGFTLAHTSKMMQILIGLLLALPIDRLVRLSSGNSFATDRKWLFHYNTQPLAFQELVVLCTMKNFMLDEESPRQPNLNSLIKAILNRPEKFVENHVIYTIMVAARLVCNVEDIKKLDSLLTISNQLAKEIEVGVLKIKYLNKNLWDDLPVLYPLMQQEDEYIFESRSKKVRPVSERSWYGIESDPSTSINQQLCKIHNTKLNKWLEKIDLTPPNVSPIEIKNVRFAPKMEVKIDSTDGTPLFPPTRVTTESLCDFLA